MLSIYKLFRELLLLSFTIIFALLLSYVVQVFFLESRIVPSTSMFPTIIADQRVLVNKVSYVLDAPERGDLIVFPSPEDETVDYIKRVIALPGETVEVCQGTVYIDDEPLNEPYILEQPSYRMAPTTVPDGCLFVLGDNRNVSFDSHLWNKWLNIEEIHGQAFFTYWPIKQIGAL